jgi:hypothetical protein
MSRYPEHPAWVARTGLLLPSIPTLVRLLPEVFRTRDGRTGAS